MSKPLLFLDVDGVLNHAATFVANERQYHPYLIDQKCLAQLKRIMKETSCDIVLSSTWRHNLDAVKVLNEHGITFVGHTPRAPFTGKSSEDAQRGWEVRSFLEEYQKKNEVKYYAIIDDDSDFVWDQPLFKTNFYKGGLTEQIADEIIVHLNTQECLNCGNPMTSVQDPILKKKTGHLWHCDNCMPEGHILMVG